MEPQWTKQVPNWLLCDWFYAFFVINAFVLTLLVVSVVYLIFSSGLPKGIRGIQIFFVMLQLVLTGTTTLFYYLICDRALKPTS